MSGRSERLDADQIKAAVSIAGLIGETLTLRREGRYLVALCPFHGEKTPSFCVYPDHYHCFGCGAHGDVFTWLMQAHGMTFPEAVRHLGGADRERLAAVQAAPAPSLEPDDTAQKQELARRIWTDSQDPHGSPVETYLQHRGVRLPDEPVIRFHPQCPRKEGRLPAMVALMTDPATGQPCAVHRTFLLPDGTGKAAVPKPKMMLGPAGVIRLADPIAEGLGLAEGIETALSAMQAIGWGPVWAAGTRGGIERFPVLPGHSLTIFADGDAPGLSAARQCAARWVAAGREALIHVPPSGEDWNDAARRIAA
jgi:phage/plasmid primase-like uncharacterized protein